MKPARSASKACCGGRDVTENDATRRTDTAPPWRVLAVAAAWPMLMGWISGVADPIGHLERLLDGHGWVPWIETPVIASQLWLVPETALAFAPGLMVMHQLGVRDAERDPPPRSVWRWTVGVGFAILLAAGTTHVLVDLPTGDLGPPEVVARVRLGTRVIDVALNAVVPALAEELYFRGSAAGWCSSTSVRLFRTISTGGDVGYPRNS